MKVKMNEIGGNILDTIQFAHRHQRGKPQPFSIEFDVGNGFETTAYFTTKNFEIMDAIAAEWPNATIITTK
jgi:hypothetical protein